MRLSRSERIPPGTIEIKGLSITTLCVMLLAACAGPEARKTEQYMYTEGRPVYVSGEQTPKEEIVATVWDAGEKGHVRIVQMEGAAQSPNDHPVTVTPEQIREALGELRLVNGRQAGGAIGRLFSREKESVPVFTEGVLDRIAEPLATALAQAQPRQDVTFAVTGEAGLLQGILQSPVVTTGRVFYKNGQLNVIFGLVHGEYRDQLRASGVLRAFTPGSRTRQLEASRTVLPGEAMRYAASDRQDWIQISPQAWSTTPGPVAATQVQSEPAASGDPHPSQAEPAAAMPSAAPPVQPSDLGEYGADYYQNIEMRLKRLIRLREQGLITEEEYRERRRAIISEL